MDAEHNQLGVDILNAREAERSRLVGSAQRCAHYHGMRYTFFDTAGKVINVITAFSATAIFVDILPPAWLASAKALTALFAIVSLVVGFPNKARDHLASRAGYMKFIAKLQVIPVHEMADIHKEPLAKLKGELTETFGSGLPFLTALNVIAQNRVLDSNGQTDSQRFVPFFHRCLAHIYPFTGYYSSGSPSGNFTVTRIFLFAALLIAGATLLSP